jgi:hypothetical protein
VTHWLWGTLVPRTNFSRGYRIGYAKLFVPLRPTGLRHCGPDLSESRLREREEIDAIRAVHPLGDRLLSALTRRTAKQKDPGQSRKVPIGHRTKNADDVVD